MLKDSPKKTGQVVEIKIRHDHHPRTITIPPEFESALKKNKTAKTTFDQLSPSRQKEIVRYLASLKTTASLKKNILRALNFLEGKERFVGREKP